MVLSILFVIVDTGNTFMSYIYFVVSVLGGLYKTNVESCRSSSKSEGGCQID